MPPLPVVSGKEAVSAFERRGWQFVRPTGSHMIMVREGMRVTLAIPDHREIDRGTLRSLIRIAGLGVEEFIEALAE
jgi:predicted RNA binding protein YcfA (HicA-like mRNA interferase family)